MNKLCKNDVWISGEIIDSKPVFTYMADGIKYFQLRIAMTRYSGIKDIIPVVFTEDLLRTNDTYKGCFIKFKGRFASRNDDKGKLILYVLAETATYLDPEYYGENYVELEGFICKKVGRRETPSKKVISDLMLSVKKPHEKGNYYIPCLAWGSLAHWTSRLEVGKKVSVIGRIQSREYTKNGTVKIAYELSASKIGEVME